MAEDHLDTELSVSGQLTESGLKLGAKSRAVAAIDRLLGGIIDIANAPLENIAKRSRAKGEADVAAIRRAGEMRLELLDQDPATAQRIYDQHLKVIGRRHQNKVAVAQIAVEDLTRQPPSEEESASGADALDSGFMDRFERYADDATTDQLRERWGRILAAEIRKPGTFSAKVLRVIDELEPATATLFEDLCEHRLGDCVPKILCRKYKFDEEQLLTVSELIIDPSVGQLRLSVTKYVSGSEITVVPIKNYAITFPKSKIPPDGDESAARAITNYTNGPAIPIYLLTPAGQAISSILQVNESRNACKLAESIAHELIGVQVQVFDRSSGKAVLMQTFQKSEDAGKEA